MDYNTLKLEVDSNKRLITKIKLNLKSIGVDLENLRGSRKVLEDNYQNEVRRAKKSAFESHHAQQVSVYDDKVRKLEQGLSDLKQRYKEELDNLTEDNIGEMYTGEQEVNNEIKASLNVLQDRLKHAISPRFQKELEDQLEVQQIDLESQNLEPLLKYFNRQSVLIERMSRKSTSFDFLGYFSNQFIKKNPISSEGAAEDDRQERIKLAMLVGIGIIILVAAAYFVFPAYAIALTVFTGYNISKHYRIYSALIAQKAVKDNITQIEEALKSKVLAQLEEQRETLKLDFEAALDEAERSLGSARSEAAGASTNANSSFQFDDSSLRNNYEAASRAKDDKENSLVAEKRDLTQQLNGLYQKLKKSEDDLRSVAGSIQSDYLDFEKIGSDVVFRPRFIFDVKDTKPVFFDHPQNSCLFVYNDITDVINFVRLLSVQLRIKLNPFNLAITTIDAVGLGIDYLVMQPQPDKKDESVKNLFRVLTNKADINERLEAYNAETVKRIKLIRVQHQNIAEYNEFMLERDSLTESYDFLFYQDPDLADLQSTPMKQILKNGGCVGIFAHLFLHADVLRGSGDAGHKLVEDVSTIYLLKDGDLFKRARDFVHENMIKSSN